MKPHILKRNEDMRKDYRKFLIAMGWKEAVRKVAKRYFLTYSTTIAIVYHQGKYKQKGAGTEKG